MSVAHVPLVAFKFVQLAPGAANHTEWSGAALETQTVPVASAPMWTPLIGLLGSTKLEPFHCLTKKLPVLPSACVLMIQGCELLAAKAMSFAVPSEGPQCAFVS